jgi:hypothetical protein
MAAIHRKSTRPHRRRKAIISAGIALSLLFAGGAAFAASWFEGYGSTASTETTGATTTLPVAVTATSLNDQLLPDGPAGNIYISVANNQTQSVTVSKVVVSVASTTDAACTAADFTVTQPKFQVTNSPGGATDGDAATLPYTMPGGSGMDDNDPGGTGNGAEATVALNADAPVDCANVTVNLSEVVS